MRIPHIKEIRQREIRKLNRETDRLYDAQSALGLMKLEKPIRHGWIRHLKLREDIEVRKDAAIFQEIVKKCSVEVWGTDKKDADRNWVRFHKHNRQVQYPGLHLLIGEKIKTVSDKARLMFDGLDWQWIYRKGYVKRYICKAPRHYFITAYSRCYVTHLQVVDPDIKSRLEEIGNLLNDNKYYAEAYRVNLYKNKWMPYKYHKRKRKRVKDVMKNYNEEEFDRRVYRPLSR